MCFQDIFSRMESSQKGSETDSSYRLELSYLEIYKEEVGGRGATGLLEQSIDVGNRQYFYLWLYLMMTAEYQCWL